MNSKQFVIADTGGSVPWWDDLHNSVVYSLNGGTGKGRGCPRGSTEFKFLEHIIEEYDRLAPLTVFLESDAAKDSEALLRARNVAAETGFRALTDDLMVVAQHSDLGQFCPDYDKLHRQVFGEPSREFKVGNQHSLFAVSRENIHSRSRDFYRHAASILRSSHLGPKFLRESWHFVFSRSTGKRGIVTAGDANMFRDLQFLIRSIRAVDDHPILVYDLGLKYYQLRWCLEQKNLSCRPLPPLTKEMRRFVGSHRWQAWLKPTYLLDAPYDEILWIDADCVVLHPLAELFDKLAKSPLLFPEVVQGGGRNHRELYRSLPVPQGDPSEAIELNNGVIGFQRLRDQDLLHAWVFAVQWAVINKGKRHLIRWYDQGALLWATLRTRNEANICGTQEWNYPASRIDRLLFDSVNNGTNILDCLREKHPSAKILHCFGLNKLSVALNDEVGRLFL